MWGAAESGICGVKVCASVRPTEMKRDLVDGLRISADHRNVIRQRHIRPAKLRIVACALAGRLPAMIERGGNRQLCARASARIRRTTGGRASATAARSATTGC